MKNKRFRQGQTKWLVVVYKPDTIQDYEDCYVAAVHRCFITKVHNKTIFYDIDGDDHRLCGFEYWDKKLHSSFRKAYREASRRIASINEKIESGALSRGTYYKYG